MPAVAAAARHLAHTAHTAPLARLAPIHRQPVNHQPAACCLPTSPCSRPTAVNLSIAAEALKRLAGEEAGRAGATAASVTAAVVAACQAMMAEDVAANKVGEAGSWQPACTEQLVRRAAGRPAG